MSGGHSSGRGDAVIMRLFHVCCEWVRIGGGRWRGHFMRRTHVLRRWRPHPWVMLHTRRLRRPHRMVHSTGRAHSLSRVALWLLSLRRWTRVSHFVLQMLLKVQRRCVGPRANTTGRRLSLGRRGLGRRRAHRLVARRNVVSRHHLPGRGLLRTTPSLIAGVLYVVWNYRSSWVLGIRLLRVASRCRIILRARSRPRRVIWLWVGLRFVLMLLLRIAASRGKRRMTESRWGRRIRLPAGRSRRHWNVLLTNCRRHGSGAS